MPRCAYPEGRTDQGDGALAVASDSPSGTGPSGTGPSGTGRRSGGG